MAQAVLKAVQTARLTQTRLLLQMGADVNGRDVKGKTPLIHALLLQDPNVRIRFLRLLLKAGAVVSVVDRQRMNALMWACRVTGSQEVRLLLRHADEDLNLNAQNVAGQTALWVAVDGGKVDTVRQLLKALSKHELSSEVPDHKDVTPAMRAAALGHLDCLQALIAHLDTTGKSNNTLINITKVNQILKSTSIVNKPKKTSFNPRPENPESKTPTNLKLPTIQIISSSYHALIATKPKLSQPEQSEGYALFSLEFHRDPTRCSTPISFSRPLPSISHRPHRSDRVSSILLDPEHPYSDHSLLGTEGAGIPADRSTPVKTKTSVSVKFEDHGHTMNDDKHCVSTLLTSMKKMRTKMTIENQENTVSDYRRCVSTSLAPMKMTGGTLQLEYQQNMLNHHARCVSTPLAPLRKIRVTKVKTGEHGRLLNGHRLPVISPPVTGSLDHSLSQSEACDRPAGRLLLKPLVTMALGRRSVQNDLPELFDIIAQQTSDSFRKTAVKPVPRKLKTPPRGTAGAHWSKLRGVALLTTTTKGGNKGSKLHRGTRPRHARPTALKQ